MGSGYWVGWGADGIRFIHQRHIINVTSCGELPMNEKREFGASSSFSE